MELPGDRGSITFDRVERFAGLSIRHDPAKNFTLVSSLVALLSLIASLIVKRRRIFVRLPRRLLLGRGRLLLGARPVSGSVSGSAPSVGRRDRRVVQGEDE